MNPIRMIRIKWNNRHFAREINAQLAQYRQYKKLLATCEDPEDREFYAYERDWYYDRISNRAGINPNTTRRFRIR